MEVRQCLNHRSMARWRSKECTMTDENAEVCTIASIREKLAALDNQKKVWYTNDEYDEDCYT